MKAAEQKNTPVEPTELENHRLWEEYWRQPDDPLAQETLLEQYLPLARRILGRLMIRLPSFLRYDDLLNSALIGLFGAITRFNPEMGTSFQAFAARRIRGAILDELRACDPLSRRQREILNDVERVTREWLVNHSEMPEEEQIAEALNINLHELNMVMDHGQPWLSLDMPCGGADGGMLVSEAVSSPDALLPDKEAQSEEMRCILRKAFRGLSVREQKILYLYYYEELRLREIALLFEVTEARVCQIHSLAVVKLRQAINAMIASPNAAR